MDRQLRYIRGQGIEAAGVDKENPYRVFKTTAPYPQSYWPAFRQLLLQYGNDVNDWLPLWDRAAKFPGSWQVERASNGIV